MYVLEQRPEPPEQVAAVSQVLLALQVWSIVEPFTPPSSARHRDSGATSVLPSVSDGPTHSRQPKLRFPDRLQDIVPLQV